jgi:hypothetical protein
VLNTTQGLLLIDLETCCRGPVEFDIAHAPEDVSEHYPAIRCGKREPLTIRATLSQLAICQKQAPRHRPIHAKGWKRQNGY